MVNVSADWVNISGFTIQYSGSSWPDDVGIDVHSNYSTITGNTISNNNVSIYLRDSSDNTISGNTISSGWDSIYLRDSSDNTISGNTITSDDYCIYLWYSPDNTISGNTISSGWHGIFQAYLSTVTITGNTITDSGYCGISLHSGCNTISGNNISNNTVGIQLDCNLTNNNTITGNTISNNGHGFELYDSSDNTISGNTINNNYYGIFIPKDITYYSYNNIIYHNDFIDNTKNSYDECTNSWDNGYPFGGNFWSNYSGDDLFNGPDQDIPGPDGIGDSPYNISGDDNQDQYPLMNPFEKYYILNISTPTEVEEGIDFNVTVKSEGGTAIPNATVEFNDEIKTTALTGTVHFTAPQVEEDTYYDIIVNKEGYTGDNETILVKDVPVEFVSTFIFGRIDNLTTGGDIITFEAVNIRCITFFPFTFNAYTSGEKITISKDYIGLITPKIIFALCKLFSIKD